MNDSEVRAIAVNKYCEVYPADRDVFATDVVRSTFGGYFVVVRATEPNDNKIEEIDYVSDDGCGEIFRTTEHLVGFLDRKSKPTLVHLISNKSFVSALAFILLIVVVSGIGLIKQESYNKEIAAALSSALGAAAGFFFGSKQN